MDKFPHHISTLRGTAKTVICTERRFSPLDCQLPLLTHLKYYILLRLKNTAAETQSSWDAEKKPKQNAENFLTTLFHLRSSSQFRSPRRQQKLIRAMGVGLAAASRGR